MAEAAEDWQPVATQQPTGDDWQPVAAPEQPTDTGFLHAIRPYAENVVDAFGQGFKEGFGPERLGVSAEDASALSKAGLFAPEGAKSYLDTGWRAPFYAFNEMLTDTLVRTGQIVGRGMTGLYRGAQAAGVEAGLPNDIVSMPEAFFGSPGGLRTPRAEFRPGEAPARVAEDVRPPGPDIAKAADLGVIGPERQPITEGTPKEVAERTVAARRAPDDKITQEVGGGDNPWRDRFDQFVGRLEAPEDVKQLIRDAATENGEYLPAREGDIPLSHVEDIASAAGVAPGEINTRGLGRNLRNDAEVRVAMQMMMQVTENVKSAARDVKADGSPESMIKLQEAIMRRDLAVEQVVGMRAEWGRTGNVFQEFMRDVKDQETLSDFLKGKGRTPADLHDIAHAVDSLDRESAAKVLNDLRGRQPGWLYYTWVQGLISGPLTHTKYVAANALYATSEYGVTTPIASLIGKAKQLLGGAEADRVFFGETAAGLYGWIAATPKAFMATARSIKAGVRAPLESELAVRDAMMARGEKVPFTLNRTINPVTGQNRPQGKFLRIPFTDLGFAEGGKVAKVAARVIGAPGDVAGGIHTFFKILGERAGIEAEAYRATAQEGLHPTDLDFWSRRSEIAKNPTEEMQVRSIEGAYKSTFMQELGPRGKAFQRFVKETPGLRWLFPFTHIPVNLIKATYEHTPFAVLDSVMREDIAGKNGGVAQDKAVARMIAGSAVMSWVTNAAMNGYVTGDLPRDPKERDAWNLAGKQPNSILIGNNWVSYARFGPVGDLAALGANTASVIEYLHKDDDDAMGKATVHAANAAGRMIVDEVGFQSLANLFEAYHDPDKAGVRWVVGTASSFLPFSSALSQTASGMDPSMREAKTIIDGLKYRIPLARETLLPKRDWTGQPVANPQFGNILRQRQANVDPVDHEMLTLGIHPAPPQNRVGGVKLPPAMYDAYQVRAGAYTRTALEQWVREPGWSDLPLAVREQVFRSTIRSAHGAAAAAMQAANPQIIQLGIDNRIRHLEGQKAEKLRE